MQLGVVFVGLACLGLACTPAQTRTDSQATRAPVPEAPATPKTSAPALEPDSPPASEAPVVETAEAPASAGNEAAPAAVGPIAPSQIPSGLEAVRACLQYHGEVRLAPKPAYQAKSARALATKLGFRARPEPPLEAFCEPELQPSLCAYTDCTVPGVAFTWKPVPPREGHGATGLLVIEEKTGQARAYAVEQLELWEPEFACNCMGGSEFARVTRPEPDIVVVAYLAETRPARMCNEASSTSTWFLDEALHPVAVIKTEGVDTGPTAVEIRRSNDQIHVRVPGRCEAVVTWSELKAAASAEAER